MTGKFVWTLGALTFMAAFARAQDQPKYLPDVPAPTAPFVAKAPNPSAWTILVKPKAKGPVAPSSSPILPPKYLKSQQWIKSGDKMRCINEWTDGAKTTAWVFGSVMFFESPQGEGIKLFNPASFPTYHDYAQGDFERMDWLSAADYLGAIKYQDEPCYLFRATHLAPKPDAREKRHNLSKADFHAPTSPTTVLISVNTHLPVLVADDDGQYQYEFQTPPPGELQMAEPFASLWKAYTRK